MAKEKPTTVRLSPTNKAALNAYARHNNRTASNAIETFIEQGLKREGYLTSDGRLGNAAMVDAEVAEES